MKSYGYVYGGMHFADLSAFKGKNFEQGEGPVEVFINTQSATFAEFLEVFNAIAKEHGRKGTFRKDDKAQKQFNARLREGYTLDDLKTAIINLHEDRHHIETGFKYATPEFITRADKLQLFFTREPKLASPKPENFNDLSPDDQHDIEAKQLRKEAKIGEGFAAAKDLLMACRIYIADKAKHKEGTDELREVMRVYVEAVSNACHKIRSNPYCSQIISEMKKEFKDEPEYKDFIEKILKARFPNA